jgi:hypothetical protein
MVEIRRKSEECRKSINSTSTRTNQLLELIEGNRHQKIFYFGDEAKLDDVRQKFAYICTHLPV